MDVTSRQLEIDGLQFAEGPRWHGDAFWCSDMFGHRVLRRRGGEEPDEVVRMPFDNPSGLGWLPTGELLVVAMQTRSVHRSSRPGDLQLHADLSELARGMTNDMVVAANGIGYVGDSGLPSFGEVGQRQPGQILAIDADGRAFSVADDLDVPNGMVLTPDGATLIVAESFGARLTAFKVASDGSLRARRTHAELRPPSLTGHPVHPDGICLDADSGIWVADLTYRQVIRVGLDGDVTDTITFEPLFPIACVLGGEDRRRLFVCLSEHVDITRLGTSPVSHVISIEVSTPGAGVP